MGHRKSYSSGTKFILLAGSIVPGHNYYSEIMNFLEQHVRVGDKYFEFIKCSQDNGFCCQERQSELKRIPEPMPDRQTNAFKYLHARIPPLK